MFIGIKPGERVVDFNARSQRLISPKLFPPTVVGPTGHVYAFIPTEVARTSRYPAAQRRDDRSGAPQRDRPGGSGEGVSRRPSPWISSGRRRTTTTCMTVHGPVDMAAFDDSGVQIPQARRFFRRSRSRGAGRLGSVTPIPSIASIPRL